MSNDGETILLLCPGCRADGLSRFGKLKRFACADCGAEFDEPVAQIAEDQPTEGNKMTGQSTDIAAAITLLIESAQGIVDALALLRKQVDAIDSPPPEIKTQPSAPIAQQSLLPAKADGQYAQRKQLSDAALRLWKLWVEVHNKPTAVRTKARVLLIARWLKMYGEDQLGKAIQGCALSPHHMGVNNAGTLYNSIELIFRDPKHIEQFIEIYDRTAAGQIQTSPARIDYAEKRERAADEYYDYLLGDGGTATPP